MAPATLEVPAGLDLFPYASVREGQRALIADVKETAERGGHLVAMAPTGLGKTVSTLAPLVAYALKHRKRVFFLTSKQSQHRLAVDTLKDMRRKSGVPFVVSDVIGKQDMCPRREAREMFSRRFSEFCHRQQVSGECRYWENPNGAAVKLLKKDIHHVEHAVIVATDMEVCPHQAALDVAAQAHVVVCDYNYFFSDLRSGIAERLKIDLSDVILVVDEAHNLPDRIRDHLTLELNEHAIANAIDELMDIDASRVARLVESLKDLLPDLAEAPKKVGNDVLMAFADEKRGFAGAERLVPRDEFMERVSKHLGRVRGLSLAGVDYDGLVDELEAAGAAYEKEKKEGPRGIDTLREFLANWRIERRGLARVWKRDPAPTLQYLVLDPSVLARPVFEGVHASVIMSGTLHPMEMTRDVLGLGDARAVLKAYRSPFPRENRLVLVDGDVTTSYQERSPEMYDRIATRLAGVADAIPGNVAAFFPSYGILEEVRLRIGDKLAKPLVVEARELGKSEKQALVARLRDDPADALLMGVQGGSLSEGYDYENNLLKGVVVVGLPFAAPTLEVQSLIAYYEQKFGKANGRNYAYVYPTMSRVLQAAGRLIRGPGDRGVVVLMDKRFAWGSYRDAYPDGFEPRVARDLLAEVRGFWRPSAGLPR